MSDLLLPLQPDYADYLRDESRLAGGAEGIAFPRAEPAVAALLAHAAGRDLVVTVQGARTGITGGAVPRGGVVLNLSRMNRLLGLRRDAERGVFVARVEPGMLLSELNDRLARQDLAADGWDRESREALDALRAAQPFHFPPDPTETGASLGGMAASNASGARSYAYGPVRRHVQALRLALADGSVLSLRRPPAAGAQCARGLHFRLAAGNGRALEGDLPDYRMPETKNAAGLYVRPDMELVDLLVGCEGTLGVLTELEILLAPSPPEVTGLMCFFPGLPGALEFVRRLRVDAPTAALGAAREGDGVAAIEFFDRAALGLLGAQKHSKAAFADLPEVPTAPEAAVYTEVHARTRERCDDAVLTVADILARSGGDPDATWMAERPPEVARLRDFRHALPEAVNLVIDERRRVEPALTKLGTDMAVPADSLEAMIDRYRADVAGSGLEAVIFGHVGASHLHVNILPRSMDEYRQGHELYERWARAAVDAGGTVSAEHGIGKLKVDLLRIMYGDRGLEQIRRTIEVFNPGFRLNRGNMVGYP